SAGLEQVERVKQYAADCPEGSGAWPGDAIIETEPQALRPLPATAERHVGPARWAAHAAEQQIQPATEHHQWQQLIEPVRWHRMGQPRTQQRAQKRADQRATRQLRLEQPST